ncbi:hypothetical protein K9O30_02925 [Clostridium bowmanii]|uniref:hypothetical protein n=1 Tax=Clostridium bowmanii TaxID=132925 RepID=UPI001C0AB2C1|nr:hypothetical protein [Clostridium bowmanii]MBU3188318.1 hypothetical protein [Clostridium bowmanii]MCA1072706.1 hypothetical protein [Clostridium bowmanii]
MKNLFKLSSITKGLICVFLIILTIIPNNVFAVTNTKKVSATNGKVTVTFKYALTTTQKIKDFVVTQSINKGTTKVVKPTKITKNSTKKIIALTVPVIAKTSAIQSVVYRVSYKKDISISSTAMVIAKVPVIVADKANAAIALVVKSLPGMVYKTLGTIKAGTAVGVYGGVPVGMDQDDWYGYQQYGWSKIKYGNVYAWVKTHELRFANPYNWAPGIKEKFENDIVKQGYARDKTSIHYKIYELNKLPAGTIGAESYQVYTDVSGQQCVVIVNVKTGWYHG